ncbi:MAG: entericidin A/B family lipoprotein [Alphaproteobacteria bacterium]|nr:entericidin A/B family lipoprotein [Alphaproteobacteria bacterium]
MNLTKKILVIALLTAVAACNTVKGAGQDIESVGRAGDRAIHN